MMAWPRISHQFGNLCGGAVRSSIPRERSGHTGIITDGIMRGEEAGARCQTSGTTGCIR